MAQTRFTCTLTTADEPACQSCARVTIVDTERTSARACPRHALDALNGAQVNWPDSKGFNEWEPRALELAENEASSASSHAREPPNQTASGPPRKRINLPRNTTWPVNSRAIPRAKIARMRIAMSSLVVWLACRFF